MMIITLLTDFGSQDYFVGAMKGVILSINPNAKIIDITHKIPPQDIRAAAFTLANYYKMFPPKTIHICVVDPGVGSNRRAILVETEEYYFVTPDNGTLSYVFDAEKDFRVFELTNEKYFRHPVSQTFHGRDIFAPVAAHLSNGVQANEFGKEIKDFVRFNTAPPHKISDNKIAAEIIHADRFGNLITNLRREDLSESFILKVNGNLIEKHLKYYAEVSKDEVFSIIGSAGFLEIVAFHNSASRLLKTEAGDKIFLIAE